VLVSDNMTVASSTPRPNCRVNVLNDQGAFVRVFGCAGDEEGEFASPRCILIHPRTQDVIIVDTGNNRVQYFNADGEYERSIGGGGGSAGTIETSSPPIGQLCMPMSASFDHKENLLVCDTGNCRVSCVVLEPM
jgi:tripartite motif-containing protein 71